MARFLPTLARGTKDLTLRRAMSGPGYIYGLPAVSRWSTDKIVHDGFERTIWVYRGVDTIADNAARLPIIARRGNPIDGEIVDDYGPLRLLNRKTNVFEYAYEFRYRLSTQLLLSKRGAFIEKVRDRIDRVQLAYLLPPGRTSPIPHEELFVSAYRVVHSDEGHSDLPADDVAWIRKPHPTDPYSGSTPLEAAALSIDLDFYARLYNRTFLLNDGRPGGIVAVKGDLIPEDAQELKRRFAGGPQRAGRTSVIEADDIAWIDTAATPRDAQYLEQLGLSKEEVLLALGVPESVIGNASGRTFANADAEERIFWRATMLPHLRLLEQGYDDLFASQDDEIFLVHDTRSVDVLQHDDRMRREELLKEFRAGVISADEYRSETGRDPHDHPFSRALWIRGRPAPAPGDVMPADPLARTGASEPKALPGPDGHKAETNGHATKAVPASVDVDKARDSADRRLSRWETQVEDMLVSAFDRQEQVILTRLNGPKARIGTRHDHNPETREDKALDTGYVVDLERWRDELDTAATNLLERMFTDTAKTYLEATGKPDALEDDTRADELTTAAKDRAGRIVDSGMRRAEKALELLDSAEADGATVGEMSELLVDHYDHKSAWAGLLARSETAGAYNQASMLAVRWSTMPVG